MSAIQNRDHNCPRTIYRVSTLTRAGNAQAGPVSDKLQDHRRAGLNPFFHAYPSYSVEAIIEILKKGTGSRGLRTVERRMIANGHIVFERGRLVGPRSDWYSPGRLSLSFRHSPP